MTTTTPDRITAGDVLVIAAGNGKDALFTVEEALTADLRGTTIYTLHGYRDVPFGLSGPYTISLLDGEVITVR